MSEQNEGAFGDEDSDNEWGDYTVDSSEDTTESIASKSSAAKVNKEGNYHFQVDAVTKKGDVSKGETPYCLLTCAVLAASGENQDQVGRILFHQIYLLSRNKDKSNGAHPFVQLGSVMRGKLMRAGIALGVIDPSQVGSKFAPDWNIAQGRQFCATVEFSKGDKIATSKKKDQDEGSKDEFYNDKFEVPWGDFFPLSHDDVADDEKWPKDLLAASQDDDDNGDVDDGV